MVTGATRGIGLAAAQRLGAEGARLVLTARGEDDGRDVEARLHEAGVDAVFVAADMTDEEGPMLGLNLTSVFYREMLGVGPDADRASLSAPNPTGRVAGQRRSPRSWRSSSAMRRAS